ncbi:MAG TPA: hypothetical protein VFO65_06505 [Acidimicrobiales bacterium]|nr:hypothetical protein [Acidimicrobiales bacterium]
MEHHDRGPEEVPAEELAEERLTELEEAGVEPTRDIEAPEGDALEQVQEVAPGRRRSGARGLFDASEADVQEQAMEVPLDDDPGYGG